MNDTKSQLQFATDRLQWCFSSLGCASLSLDEIIAMAQNNGIPAIELRAVSGSLDLVALLNEYKANDQGQYRAITESGIIKMFDTSFNLAKAEETDFDYILKLAILADELRVPYCRVFGGFEYSRNPPMDTLKRAAQVMQQWNKIKKTYNLNCQLAIETHDGFSSAVNCTRFFNVTGHAIPIVWDSHHTWRYGGESFADSMTLLGDNIVHVHVKDSIETAAGKIVHVLPGQGDVPIKYLLALLREMDFEFPVSLEWERLWEPELPPLTEALTCVRNVWLKPSA
jgi:sugar phosphate isomerase/epimerase